MMPRSTRRRRPVAIVRTAPSRFSGMPSVRAKLLAVPSGSRAKTQSRSTSSSTACDSEPSPPPTITIGAPSFTACLTVGMSWRGSRTAWAATRRIPASRSRNVALRKSARPLREWALTTSTASRGNGDTDTVRQLTNRFGCPASSGNVLNATGPPPPVQCAPVPHRMEYSNLERRVRQVRPVPGVGLAIGHFDINIARRNLALGQGEPERAEILRPPEGAEAVDALPTSILEEVDPGPRGIAVVAARREPRRGGKHCRGVGVLVEDIVAVTDEALT